MNLMELELVTVLLCFLVFGVAFLYASVGHGGASGYLALMALFGFAPEQMKSTALLLNMVVSLIAFIQFLRCGNFKWELFFPLAAASIPLAFLGGLTPVHDQTFRLVLGILLFMAFVRFAGLLPGYQIINLKPTLGMLIVCGAVIGYLSGLTGIGGGVILSPLMLLLGWAKMKEVAAISALFILLNSASGMGGLLIRGIDVETPFILWVLCAISGGILGSYLGAQKFDAGVLRKILAVVLLIASLKLIFTS